MFNLSCEWKAAFMMDPTKKQRVGYLVAFEGLDLGANNLAKDVIVYTPFNSADVPKYTKVTTTAGAGEAAGGPHTVTVVGAIESFSFGGGVGDPICISAYVSAQAQALLKGKLQTTLKTTKVTTLEWWIINFDEENKMWYEESFPLGNKNSMSVAGQLNAAGKDVRLNVSEEATKIAPNIDVNVYNMYFEIVPAANLTYDLHFASSAKTPYARAWGLQVGTNAAQAMSG